MADRRVLFDEGMLIIAVAIDTRSNKLLDEPVLYNRGIIQKHNNKAIEDCRTLVSSAIKEALGSKPNFSELKNIIKDVAGKFLYAKTKKHPMIIPVIMSKN